jgi:hypothetical protein
MDGTEIPIFPGDTVRSLRQRKNGVGEVYPDLLVFDYSKTGGDGDALGEFHELALIGEDGCRGVVGEHQRARLFFGIYQEAAPEDDGSKDDGIMDWEYHHRQRDAEEGIPGYMDCESEGCWALAMQKRYSECCDVCHGKTE